MSRHEAMHTAVAHPVRAAGLVWLAVLAACATGAKTDGAGTEAANASGRNLPRAELVLTSRHPGPVRVYAVSGALRVRMGTVTAFRDARMVFPPELVGRGADVHLLARPVGDPAEVMTEAFRVEAGDVVGWTLLQPLETSIATLRLY